MARNEVTPPDANNCPINEQTADGIGVGRCWHYLPDGVTCPRHGNVELEVEHYRKTGKTTKEFARIKPTTDMNSVDMMTEKDDDEETL